MAQVLSPSPTGPRTNHVVIATPDFSDTATITASASPINGTALADLVTRQPADIVEFLPLSDTVSGLTLQFRRVAAPARWDVVHVLANATPEAQWEVRAGDNTAESNGTAAYDSSGQHNHGTIEGGAVFDVGKFQGGVWLENETVDDAGQHVLTDYAGTQSGTYMLWIAPESIASRSILGHDVRHLLTDASGHLMFESGLTAAAQPLIAGVWQHVAVTFDASSGDVAIYLDGDVVLEEAGSAIGSIDVGPMRWGSFPLGSGLGFAGTIDECRFYAAILTPAEIQAEMASETPTVTASLRVHHKLNGYQSGVRTFGMSPNLATRTRRGSFLLAPYAMTNQVVQVIITDPDNTADFRVGRVFIGSAWQPERNYDWGQGIGFDDDSKATRTPTSQTMIVRRVPVPTLEFVVRHLSRRDMLANAYEIARAQGTSGEVLVCLNPEDEEFQEAVTLYGRMAEIGRLTEPHHDLWETTYRVEGFL